MGCDAHTQVYAIFGNPIRHSLSPLMHNALFERLKINATYLAFEIQKDSLSIAFEAIRSLDIKGVNITVPFKEEALHLADEIPEDIDRGIGAINTIVNKNGKLLGFNTDGPGFLLALKEELHFNPIGKKILVLGAGGAARGVAFTLMNSGIDKLWIHNRDFQRALGLSDYLTQYFPDEEVEAAENLDFLKTENIDLIVNATSLGMKENDPSPLDLRLLKNKPSVYDLIYAPSETHFLKSAKKLGLPCVNGLGMLAAQGALSFALWTDKTEGIREAMLEVLKR